MCFAIKIMPSTYVVTGASSGIGLELVKQLAARGDKVFATVRTKSSSASGIDLISSVQGDVTIIENIDIMSDDVGNALTASPLSGVQIDCLVNNAGSYNATRDLKGMEGFQEQALANISAARMMHTFNLNCCGVLRVTQALLPQLVPGSKIAVVSSGMGSIGDNGSGGSHAYRVSKAAVNMLTKGMSCDLKEKNIAVVAPGFISDCLETLEEINVEARELFIENGGENFEYIPCLNDNEYSIQFLEYIIKQNLLGWNS